MALPTPDAVRDGWLIQMVGNQVRNAIEVG